MARQRGTTSRPGYLLKRAQAALNTAMTAALREHGATISQYAVLAALDEEPGLSNADLARRAFVTPQTMNQVLRELENKQWVIRNPRPDHGRILRAGLTRAGSATVGACHQAVDAVEQQMLAHLSADRRREFAAALLSCIEALSH